MTRVAYVIWSLGLGGAEQVVIRLAAGLDRRRFEPLICCLDERGSFAAQAEEAGVEVVAMGKKGPLDAGAAYRLARLFRSRRIQVVHTHLWGGNVWGRLAALGARVPKIVISEHNLDTWKKRHHFLIDRALAPATTRLVAVSHQVREFYEARGVGRGRWQVIYNGVDTRLVPARGRGAAFLDLGLAPDTPVVALIGRLVPAKAPGVFLRAVAQAAVQVPALRALIVGDGPLRSEIEAEALRLGLAERVVFMGIRKDVPELLAGLNAVLFSSVREGLSLTMLEAMAARVPVVATAVGGTPELITHGRTGLLVPPGQPEQLAQALVGLLLDPAASAAIQEAARTCVEERFSLASMVEAHEALYEGQLGVGVRPA